MSVSPIGSQSPKTTADPRSQETKNSSGAKSASSPAAGPATTPASGDTVHLSSAAADMQALEAHINQLPDVDKSRISEIRSQISSGQYQINSARVAEKILGFEAELKR